MLCLLTLSCFAFYIQGGPLNLTAVVAVPPTVLLGGTFMVLVTFQNPLNTAGTLTVTLPDAGQGVACRPVLALPKGATNATTTCAVNRGVVPRTYTINATVTTAGGEVASGTGSITIKVTARGGQAAVLEYTCDMPAWLTCFCNCVPA